MKNKYIKQDVKRALGPVPKDKRIYLHIDYKPRRFSEYSNCRFDPEKKLWFTGPYNTNLEALIDTYGIHEATSETALAVLKDKLNNN